MPAVLGQIADAKHLSIAINCGSAGRSERAAKLMINAGFQNISVHRVI
jgi:rhodanese-related sulfurtransferase